MGADGNALPRRALLLAGGLPVLLTACGFRLRGAPQLAFRTLVTSLPDTSALGLELTRTLRSLGTVEVVSDPARQASCDVILDVLQEQRERAIVGLNSAGQVREVQLRLRLRFRLRTPGGKELIADTEILQTRDMSFSETLALAKDAEERLLYRDMQTDTVQQLMRRLAAVKSL